ncbi:hypothetical protein, partial [Streptococcus anginosus]|uniref:hypothetical protein n=1 Tax=Streptococcus anginosus TaxID=1328 RepID=UPI0029C9F836
FTKIATSELALLTSIPKTTLMILPLYLERFLVLVISFSIHDVKRPTYFDNILPKTGVLPVLIATSSA